MAGVWVAQWSNARTRPELLAWLPALLINEAERRCQLEDGRVIQPPAVDILPRNPAIQDAVDDLTALSYMHEPAVLHNLHRRFDLGSIYTYTGTILIAVNPYAKLPGLYGPEMMQAYNNVPLGKLSPHVYAIAEDAFRSMLRDEHSQSILVSGESGAGKTETTKLLLQYFASVSGKAEASMQSKVLESTPLLEAFGNARTRFNDNSSRFGRFIKIAFSRAGHLRGASVHTYLLEKSRVVRPAQGERNYHIFYQMLAGLPESTRKELDLPEPSVLHYLRQSGCYTIAGVDDGATFVRSCAALAAVGIEAVDQAQLWRVLAAILHLGNVTFTGDEEAELSKPSTALGSAARLLGLAPAQIAATMLQRRISTGSEILTLTNSPAAAEAARDALAMLLYSRVFQWLVVRINSNLAASAAAMSSADREGQSAKYWIGVLDLYGFECFAENSFEQFCINYANEKLQQQFNLHVFKLEQQEYVKEKIDWRMIEFRDNQSTVDLFEKPRTGLLALLDEEARFPKATAETLAVKFKAGHLNKSAAFEGPRFGSAGFAVQHYAGRVEYSTAEFLDKTRDYIIADQLSLLQRASAFVATLVQPATIDASPRSASTTSSSFQFASVASQFRESLAALMQSIGETAPHFIRCVKPNDNQRPLEFAAPRVAEQLRCGGVMEAVRISSAGFPSRLPFRQFFNRYRVLVASLLPRNMREGADFDYRAAASKLLSAAQVEPARWQVGITKLFLRPGVVAVLELARTTKLEACALRIQKNFRRFRCRRAYVKLLPLLATMRSSAHAWIARRRFAAARREWAATTLQRRWRVRKEALSYSRLRKAAVVFQRRIRRRNASKVALAERRAALVVVLSAAIKARLARRKFKQLRKSIVQVQCRARRWLAKRKLRALRTEARSYERVQRQKDELQSKVDDLDYRLVAESRLRSRAEESSEAWRVRAERAEKRVAELEAQLAQRQRVVERLCAEAARSHKGVAESGSGSTALSVLNTPPREKTRKLAAHALIDVPSKKNEKAEKANDGEDARATLATLKHEGELVKLRARVAALEAEAEKVNKRAEAAETDVRELEAALQAGRANDASQLEKSLVTHFAGAQRQREARKRLVQWLAAPRAADERVVNGMPLAAFAIYRLARLWSSDEAFGEFLADSIGALRAALEADKASLVGPTITLSNAALLAHLVCNQLGGVALQSHVQVEPIDLGEALFPPLPPSVHSLDEFRRMLLDLVARSFAALLQNVFIALRPLLLSSILEKREGGRGPGSLRAMGAMTELFSQLLQGFQETFLYLPLAQRLFEQVFAYVNCTLFNEILLRRELCSFAKGADVKLNLRLFEEWLAAQGAAWVGKAPEQLRQVHQTINVLMLGHKASLADAAVRADICPSLNSLQLRKLLSLYTPAADIGEGPVPLSLLSLLAEESNSDAQLLLTYTHSMRLSVSDLHYVQPKDVARLAFPAQLRDVPAEVLQQSAAEGTLTVKPTDSTKKGSKIFGWLGSK